MLDNRKYYVYERFRKDNDSCFYVGRGHGNRIDKFHRNKKHDEIANTYGYYSKIYRDKLTNQEASKLESDRIHYYVNELGYGIDINGYMDRDPFHYLTNRTFGGEDGCFKSGIENQQYCVSPKDRMGSNYDGWFKKNSERCKRQIGYKNPNFGNNTLHNKIKDRPDLRKRYYARKGKQNGRARKIAVYDYCHNFISEFDTIGECCEWLKNKLNLNTKVDNMRHNMSRAAQNNKPYLSHYFKFC